MPKPYEFNAARDEGMSYLIGVLFSDGSIIHHKTAKYFALASKDEDWIKFVAKVISAYTEAPARIRYYPPSNLKNTISGRAYTRKGLHFLEVYCTKMCEWMLEETNNRQQIPKFCYKYAVPFIEGFMDGDGGISKCKRRVDGAVKYQYIVRSFNRDEILLYDIKDILKIANIRSGDVRYMDCKGAWEYCITVRTSDYARECRFRIGRKEKLLAEYAEKYGINRKPDWFEEFIKKYEVMPWAT